jgi:alcohol dehydrogenase (cytochrome c)
MSKLDASGPGEACSDHIPAHRAIDTPSSRHYSQHLSFSHVTIAAGLLLTASQVAFAAAPTGSATSDQWLMPGGTAEGTRFSNLARITPSNVGNLRNNHIRIVTGIKEGGYQGQPLVVKVPTSANPNRMVLFAVTPWPNQLQAYDATTGTKLWVYEASPSEYAKGVACCDVVNRGAAYYNNKVVFTALDGTVVAVNASNGTQIWRKSGLANVRGAETVTGAPMIVKGVTVNYKVGTTSYTNKITDLVVVGNAGAENGIRGWVQALDLNNKGAVVWKKFNTGSDTDVGITANSKTPGLESTFTPKELESYKAGTLTKTNLGCTTWGDSSTCTGQSKWKQGGSTVWGWITADSDPTSYTKNLIFYGSANPGVWNPSMRPGSNKWGSAVFARDAATGNVVWVRQLTPHDGWDYDSMNEFIVVGSPTDSKAKQLVHFDKNGFAYRLDAKTGAVIYANPYVNVNWVQRNPDGTILRDSNGLPVIDQSMYPVEGVTMAKPVCPAPLGGKEFSPSAYSPTLGLFFLPSINFCSTHLTYKTDFISGTPFVGDSLGFTPDFDTTSSPSTSLIPTPYGNMRSLGALMAWNADGSVAWTVSESNPIWGGILTTQSGLIFYGTLDKRFVAIDASQPAKPDGTPNYLLNETMQCGIEGNPITYMGSDGKQKVAVFEGVGWLPGMFTPKGVACPSERDQGADSGVIHIFSE